MGPPVSSAPKPRIGSASSAQGLDPPARLRTKAGFAALSGASPVDASTGKQVRHRLNRGGDREANSALWRIVMVRMSRDARTRAYVERRTEEGKTTKEIMRCLKRYVAREVYRAIVGGARHRVPPGVLSRPELAAARELAMPTASGAFESLASRLEADLRTRFPAIEVRVRPGPDGTMVCEVVDAAQPWGEIELGPSQDDDELSDDEVEYFIARVVENVADNLWPDELTEPWPLCPTHRDHPLQPRLVGDVACWQCLRDSRIVVRVGELRDQL